MSVIRDLNVVRAAIKRQLGAKALKDLHREDWRLDALGVVACWGMVAALFVLLARLPLGLLWCLCFAAQGFALQALGLLSHDAFIHRRIWGDRGSWIGSIISSYPVLLLPTWYLMAHRDHHTHLGTDKDTETYKQNLDTIWKRVFFLTALGDRAAKLGKLSKTDVLMPVLLPKTEKERRRLTVERAGIVLFALGVVVAAMMWPRCVLAGYVLPLLIAAPVASTLRVILEHADVDPANDFHLGTYYRTGVITRLLFVADSGDCHLIHHIFSHIPWYRMGQATRLMRPILIERGVVERRSLLQLVVGWFVRAYPHRSLWFSVPRSRPAA